MGKLNIDINFVISYSPKFSNENINNSRVKIDFLKSVMKPNLQDSGQTSRAEKENASFNLAVSKKSHALQIKIGGASERVDHHYIIKRPLLDRHRLSSIHSHRYKPYEMRRDYNSIPHPTTPTSGVSGNLLCNKNSDLDSSPKSGGLIPITISKSGSLGPSSSVAILMPPPSRSSSPILAAAGRMTFTQSLRPNPTSTPLQSSSFTNQQKICPLAGKEVSTATLQVVGSVGVLSETHICRPNPTTINRESSRCSLNVGTPKLSQQQDLHLSTASSSARNRVRLSVSKKKAKDQLFHHLNEVIDVQVQDFHIRKNRVCKVSNNDCFNYLGNPLFFKH